MQQLTDVMKAITILSPLLEEIVRCLRSGDEPAFLYSLPATLKSRVAFELKKARTS